MAVQPAPANPRHTLSKETEAARVLLADWRDILADDDQAKADMVEGETDLAGAIRNALVRIAEIEAMQEGIGAFVKKLQERAGRLKEQEKHLRTAILTAMEIGEIRKLETDVATATRKTTPPGLVIINEDEIPAKFWKRGDPTLDRRTLLSEVKAAKEEGKSIPGVALDNGGYTLQITEG